MRSRLHTSARFLANHRWLTTTGILLLSFFLWGMTAIPEAETTTVPVMTIAEETEATWDTHDIAGVTLSHPPTWELTQPGDANAYRLIPPVSSQSTIDVVPLDTSATTLDAVEDQMVQYLEANPRYEQVFMRRMLPVRVGNDIVAIVRYVGKTGIRAEEPGLLMGSISADGIPMMIDLSAATQGKILRHEETCKTILAAL